MVKILLVDDEPGIVMITKKILAKAGYDVAEARNGEEGLRKLNEEKFDLILLDVMLPSIDGWEVCDKIKADKKTKDIPIVMFTVRTSSDSVARGKECGAVAQIDKPFGRGELIGTVERVLKGS